jgi:predicted RecB family endonuclease
MTIYSFSIGKDLPTLKEVICRYVGLVFLRTQGFEIIYPALRPGTQLWDFVGATHVVAEKKGKKYAIRIEYGRDAVLDRGERARLLELKKTGCEPIFMRVWGGTQDDKWGVEWLPVK